MSDRRRLGVGLVGCGAAGQSFHAATLASLPELFQIRSCMDPDPDVVKEVAERVGANGTTDLDALLADDTVDVGVVASPGTAHAEQVIKACSAGKRAVLCEKPVAETVADTERILEATTSTGVPVLVGTMHRHDPALRALQEAWGDLPSRAHLVRSHAFIEPNTALADAVTEVAVAAPRPGPEGSAPSAVPATALPLELLMFAGLTWGVAVHHLPLVRLAFPDLSDLEVVTAVPASSSGYLITLRAGDRVVQLANVLHGFARTEWTFEVIAPDASAGVDFPPGYVPTRSARGWLRTSNGMLEEQSFAGANETGYRSQYRHLADVAHGAAEPLTSVADALADARLAERIVATANAQWEAQ